MVYKTLLLSLLSLGTNIIISAGAVDIVDINGGSSSGNSISISNSTGTGHSESVHLPHYPPGGNNRLEFGCGTGLHVASDSYRVASKRFFAESSGRSLMSRKWARMFTKRIDTITIDTYFHIITTNNPADAVQPDQPQKQINKMNEIYKNYSIQFSLKGTTWTTNNEWADTPSDAVEMNFMGKLRNGTYKSLNIYFVSTLSGNDLGKCTLPSSLGNKVVDPSVYIQDGCVVMAGTMPDGRLYGFNKGMTAIHETGHWLGLLHTFEGLKCTGDGDDIIDTPMQSTATQNCPADGVKDSCPSLPGLDAIHNIMDYSDDACYRGFSTGQEDRMHQMWNTFRANH